MALRRSKPNADRILEAAEKLFEKHAYADVSLRQLMSAAEVSTTAFYARFPSKESVMAALTTRLFAELYADAPRVLDRAKDLETGIVLGVDLLCERFSQRKTLVRLILAETGAIEAVSTARRRAYGMLAALLASRLRWLAEHKRIEALPAPDALAWAVVGALEIQLVRWAIWNEIDLPTMRAQMLAASRAILPAPRRRG
jgi:AcrR family transcriptional regulator